MVEKVFFFSIEVCLNNARFIYNNNEKENITDL